MIVASPLGNVTGPATTAGSFAATESGLRPVGVPPPSAPQSPAGGACVPRPRAGPAVARRAPQGQERPAAPRSP